jgi:hypothetical protein
MVMGGDGLEIIMEPSHNRFEPSYRIPENSGKLLDSALDGDDDRMVYIVPIAAWSLSRASSFKAMVRSMVPPPGGDNLELHTE